MNTSILTTFYRCTIESLLTSCITVWCWSCSSHSRKALQRVVETVQHITGNGLLSIQDIYHKRCLRKAHSIVQDLSHPARGRYGSLPARTKRQEDSFYHQAIKLLDSKIK